MRQNNDLILAIVQICISPLIAFGAVWLTFRSDLKRNQMSRNFDKQQEIFVDTFETLYKTNLLIHELSKNVISPEISNIVQDLQVEISRIDIRRLESIISLFGDAELLKLIEEWSATKDSVSNTIISLTDPQINLTTQERPDLFNRMRSDLLKADKELESIRILMKEDLSLRK